MDFWQTKRRVRGAATLVVVLALASLAVGASARAAGDTARSWGYNQNGELGNGGTTNTATPGPVSGLAGATAIAAGASHSLALLSDGTIKVWGDNVFGQLGNGNNTGPETCVSDPCSKSPIPVTGLSRVVAIGAGDEHSLALLANGTVEAWGNNTHGQLGDGTTTPHAEPKPVSGLSHVVAIAAGGFHNLALRADGTVMAWGENRHGELGNGNNTGPETCGGSACAKTPVPLGGLSGVMSISAGLVDSQSVALLSNGTVMTWGTNVNGELGNGNNTGPDTCFGHGCSKKPIPVTGVSGVTEIAAGAGYTLARLSSGTAMGWGGNFSGPLGNGTTSNSPTPPGAVSGLSGVAALAAGDGQSLALLSNGALRAWGRNDEGQLGNGDDTGPETCGAQTCSKTPIAVSGVGDATAVAAGFAHSLALVGASQALHVSRAGRGSGAVGGPGILCPLACSGRYPQAARVNLLAHAAPGTAFAGFSGACKGTGPCHLALSRDQSVTATFGRPKGTRIIKAKVNKAKHTATFRFAAPGAITGFECALVKRRPGHHKAKKPHFSKCQSPKRYRNLKPGRYTFEVRALDILGADRSPARKNFKTR